MTGPAAIPVTVLGGYLGAGKTTILNRVLADADGVERIAVLVNDFGDVNVDAALIERRDEDVIALANGCICCSLADGLVAALEQVLSLDPSPDRLIIETSGVADPAAVAAHAMTPGFRLDSVVVAAAADAIERLLDDKYVGQTVAAQLGRADLIALTKIDLAGGAGSSEVATTAARLRDAHPSALVLPVANGVIPVSVLFGRVPDRSVGRASTPVADDQFVTASWRGGVVSRDALDALLTSRPNGLVRAKGLVLIDDDLPGAGAHTVEVQVVGSRVEVRRRASDAAPGSSTSAVVAIGLRPLAPDLAGWLARLDGHQRGIE